MGLTRCFLRVPPRTREFQATYQSPAAKTISETPLHNKMPSSSVGTVADLPPLQPTKPSNTTEDNNANEDIEYEEVEEEIEVEEEVEEEIEVEEEEDEIGEDLTPIREENNQNG